MSDPNLQEYHSSKGAVIKLRPISQFKLDTLASTKIEVAVPTYATKVAGGDELNYPMDEEIAKNKGRLNEWNAYLKKKKDADTQYTKRFMEMMIWDGVDVIVPDEDSEWQRSCDYLGITIPPNPVERKALFVYNELLGTPDDIGSLITEIFTVSKIDEDAVNKIRNSFRLGASRQADKRVLKKSKRVESKSDVQSA